MNRKHSADTGENPLHIAIIGTGFGGLGMAIQLKNAGIDSFTILEKASSVGGTWRDNTYPGAACDVQSHLYSFSFEPKSDWSRKFGLQPEIRSYMESCVTKYKLRDHIRFNQEVESVVFDKDAGLWILTTKNGDTLRARTVVSATGQLNQPAYPNIEGIDRFKGKVFHSARWDHECDLEGKRVAVVGTGASAIQFVPQIVGKVSELKLFQRSAAWVIPKPDRPFTGFEQWLFDAMPLVDRIYRASIYWKNESRALAFTRFGFLLNAFKWQAKRVARKNIKDPIKRQKIIPDYPVGCKRLLLSNDWYDAINQDHLDVVTNGIERIEEDAIITEDGTRHEVDIIIYGTGFKATDFLAPMNVTGLNGLNLNDAWRDGAEAYKGISVSGFPNLFILYGPNTNLGHSSIVFMLESQIRYITQCVKLLLDPSLHYMDVKESPQSNYANEIQQKLKKTVWASGCTSWYQTASGKNTNNWPGYTFNYRFLTGTLDLQDYDLQPAPNGSGE
ncbi:flavin-containing monooxygenase [Marinobacter zhejiangensis]|uniref:Predicted flavoprotein CzcO associated with the cation diffusion facilitator CzcD n=1 Tax=Marinobacter zhejiangensis TaxID=488535 RepID=A0A1I4PG26_9GAMM|nr:NAD(P)/FAD-dependent oxidoreductase [Marinobacter zhejiangensis]SFM26590.1 Predicted flavoprotein CzcO associated with the cation diffusion facilitator CzcD [Marinobacter zhejiangensis]